MKIKFCGAATGVTGSCHLLSTEKHKILLDCGQFQGGKAQDALNEEPFPFDPAEIECVVLSHAHIDHCGRLPLLVKRGFKGAIYCTDATADLLEVMLKDSGFIHEKEAEWQSRKNERAGRKPVEPLYTVRDSEETLKYVRPVMYDQLFEINDEMKVVFNDAGHILGSAIIELWTAEDDNVYKTVFSGDLGNNDIPLLSEPTMIEDADYLVMESTYGDRLHVGTHDKAKVFLDIVSETLDNGGTVVIPSFAVGRTQEILYELNIIKEERSKDEAFQKEYETLMRAPVYVDSPLAISATEVFKNNEDLFDDETKAIMERGDNPLEFPGLKFTRTADESKALNESDEPSIIISASGMCEVGRIKHHLKHNIWNPNSTILFVGYQAPGTLGRSIVDGAKKVKIFGEEFSVKARIEYIEGYSGHADQEWLLNFVYSFIKKPKHIFLVHGEPNGQLVLKNKIVDTTQIPVTIPGYGEKYTLDDNFAVEKKYEDPIDKRYLRLEVLDRIETLQEEIEDMKNIIKEDLLSKERSDDDVKRVNEKVKELEQRIVDIIENS